MTEQVYAVYSLRTKDGTGVGRMYISSDFPIDNGDAIERTEAFIMTELRKTEPTVENLFLTFWKTLR